MRSVNHDHFLKTVREAHAAVSDHLAALRGGAQIEGSGSIPELEAILRELGDLETIFTHDLPLPPRAQRRLVMGRYVTDTWSWESKLGERLVKLCDYYESL